MKLGPFDVPGYHVGDCRALLAQLPDGCINTCVTSPPYWGLRDYGVDGQLGLEATPAEYVAAMVDVFREVRRVLRDDGTLWLNLGDCYVTNPRGPGGAASSTLTGTSDHARRKRRWNAMPHPKDRTFDPKARGRSHAAAAARGMRGSGLKHKDLVGIPHTVAFALRDQLGFYLRQDNVWHKPNPMPDPTTDRTTRAHEYVFELAKSEEYFYDAAAIAEPAVSKSKSGNKKRQRRDVHGGIHGDSRHKAFSVPWEDVGGTRNKRSVWTIATARGEGEDDDHFAVMPDELAQPCILAGCPAGGVVLDPFGGSGTVGRVAEDLGRRWILFDLNPAYAKIAARKTAQTGMMFLDGKDPAA